MGVLREKAETERRDQEQQLAERRKREEETNRRRFEEQVRPVVEHLQRWSGEKIDPSQLQPVPTPGMGPPRWEIVVDGFELRVTTIGSGRDCQVEIEQKLKDGSYRPIEAAMDLLAQEPEKE